MLDTAPVSITHVSKGTDNALANIASRSITQLDDNSAFLTHFDSVFPLTGQIMATCQPAARAAIQRDLNAARSALDAATVDGAVRATNWRWWSQHCTECGIYPWLRDIAPATQSQLLLGFATRTRTGHFGKGQQVGSQTVEKALHHVAQAFVLEGYPDFRRIAGSGGSDLALPFTHLLKSYQDKDPVPRPQAALPVNAIKLASAACLDPIATPRDRAVANLIVIAFFFLLRVGEYTRPHDRVVTRTVQFRVCDVRLWQGQTLLPPHNNPSTLAAASSVTLTVDNQTNGQRGDTVAASFKVSKAGAAPNGKQDHWRLYINPRLYVAQRGGHRHVLGHDGTHEGRNRAYSEYWKKVGTTRLLMDDLTRVGAHLLRASGAMALWLSGHSPEAIMKMGPKRSSPISTLR